MRRPLVATALVLAWPAAADEPPAAPPPDPELLVFLGEVGGEDADLIVFMETGAAKKALKKSETKDPKEDDHE